MKWKSKNEKSKETTSYAIGSEEPSDSSISTDELEDRVKDYKITSKLYLW